MSNNIQKLLHEALKAIAKQVISYKNGTEYDDAWFRHNQGICGNVWYYNKAKYRSLDIADKVDDELEILLIKEYGDCSFPFNGDAISYFNETANRTIWNNSNRLEFIMRYKD